MSACCRPAGVLRSRFCSRGLSEALAPGIHGGSSYGKEIVPLPLSPPTTRAKIPHSLVHNVIIEREFPGAECSLPGVSSCSSIFPSFDIPYEPPAWSWRECSELMSIFVAKSLLEEQQSSACWEWITNCELRYLENTSIY